MDVHDAGRDQMPNVNKITEHQVLKSRQSTRTTSRIETPKALRVFKIALASKIDQTQNILTIILLALRNSLTIRARQTSNLQDLLGHRDLRTLRQRLWTSS